MRLAWVDYRYGDGPQARGYRTLHDGLMAALAKRVSLDVTAPGVPGQPRAHLHVCPPHWFRPAPGKNNVLFTMWEGERVPDDLLPFLKSADGRIVPSQFCAEVWAAAGLDALAVAPLGLAPEILATDPSRGVIMDPSSPRRLRYLWLGSTVARKGWEIIAPAWRRAFDANRHNVELYMKTLPDKLDADAGTVKKYFNDTVVMDKRDLSAAELAALYASADVFLFPSYAEGFGLPALEAMAAGCLVIAPKTGGLREFVREETALVLQRSNERVVEYGTPYKTALPTAEDLAHCLAAAWARWGTPLAEAVRQHGTRTARAFTWDACAEKVAEALRSFAYPAGMRRVV